MIQPNAKRIFATLAKTYPNARTELLYQTPFELLVAVMLSAQATDKCVNKATERLYPVANTPAQIVSLGLDGLLPYLKTINFYNNKAKNIIATATILIEQYQGQVPNTRKALEALPGVGRKTANVVLNVAFNQPTMAVDTHVFRVANRTKLGCGKTPREVEEQLLLIIPKAYLLTAHHLLILHGRYTCTARKPKCASCPIHQWCLYPEKTHV